MYIPPHHASDEDDMHKPKKPRIDPRWFVVILLLGVVLVLAGVIIQQGGL